MYFILGLSEKLMLFFPDRMSVAGGSRNGHEFGLEISDGKRLGE